MIDPVIGVFIFFISICVGSFLNVVIYRFPKKESIVFPRSRCGACQTPIHWFDNIPIASWFILGGKCRHCKQSFSFRYPLVEFLTGIGTILLYMKLGLSITFIEFTVFYWMLITISFIDIDHMIIPNLFSFTGICLGLLGGLFNPERHFGDSLMGVIVGGGFLWSVAYFYFLLRKKDGLGGGDIKLIAWIGAYLGWKAIPFVILTSSIVGSIAGLLFMIQSKKGVQVAIPFGPYLALGALIYILAGHEIAHWYMSVFLPGL